MYFFRIIYRPILDFDTEIVAVLRTRYSGATITCRIPKHTKEEEEKLYRLRIDETFRAYTVIDVLTKVYRRSFLDDLMAYLGDHPDEFKQFEKGWKLSRAWINDLQLIRSESVFFQEAEDFHVDILVEARIKIEETVSFWIPGTYGGVASGQKRPEP